MEGKTRDARHQPFHVNLELTMTVDKIELTASLLRLPSSRGSTLIREDEQVVVLFSVGHSK